jgi:hypothetical protein
LPLQSHISQRGETSDGKKLQLETTGAGITWLDMTSISSRRAAAERSRFDDNNVEGRIAFEQIPGNTGSSYSTANDDDVCGTGEGRAI